MPGASLQVTRQGRGEGGRLVADSRTLAESKIRRRTLALQVGVLTGWGAGALGLAIWLAALTPLTTLEHPLHAVVMYVVMGLTTLAPLGVWAGRVIKQRDSAARMALIAADPHLELEGLGPSLAGLVADARLVRSAIEGREFDAEVALRSAWEWVHRLEELPEAERHRLADLGVDVGVSATLRWTIGDPEQEVAPRDRARGLESIAEQLGAFERDLLAASRGPYR
ncbi:MAG: hypothetical protein KC457_31405 [Myxococcales bacterium]|nr:hypothetical protein [Myxococcales bacterium]